MNALIVVVSILLLGYWFRYTCLLVLRTSSARSYAKQMADANQLSFLEVQNQLTVNSDDIEFDKLHELLDRDYRLLRFLLENGANFRPSGYAVEQQLLNIDFELMKVYYSVSRGLSFTRARQSLIEMADIVGHLANMMGERAAQAAAR